MIESSNKLSVSAGQTSTAGIKADNEDFLAYSIPSKENGNPLQLESKGIAIAIADGMSGSDGGKEASQVSVTQFLNDYYGTPESWSVKQAATKILSALNSWLFSQGQQKFGSNKGMVTTFSAIVVKSQTAHLFHVGDSRIYRYRENTLEQLTRDHRIWISNDRDYLSRALGIDTYLEIDYHTVELQANDIFLLTTDGVHDYTTDKELQDIIEEHSDPQSATDAMISASKTNQSQDNISAQLIRIDEIPEPIKSFEN